MTHLSPRPWVPAHCETLIQSIATRTSGQNPGQIADRIDALIAENLAIHDHRCFNLNPAANVMNPRAEAALSAGLGSRPSLGYPGDKYEMGLEAIEEIEVIAAELAAAWNDLKQVPCVLEKMLPLQAELSVLVARGWDGQVVSFAPQRNVHVDGILAVTHAYEGCLPPALAARARAATEAIAAQIGYVGLMCVEFFVVTGANGQDTLVVNEMAPRPHNSGHYTLDACDVSQFDLQVHAMAGLPLPAPRQHSPAIMLNLLGDIWHAGEPAWQDILTTPGLKLHLYGKHEARPGRKMGHFTVIGDDLDEALAAALAARG